MAFIKKIAAAETFLIRLEVLRKGKLLESCRFDGDDLETTLHFGHYSDQKLVGIISLFKKSHTCFSEKIQYQIRGMAILENHRGEKFGRALIIHCEEECKNHDVDFIWFNARMEACGFYEKMGYQKTGIPFEIPDVGEHILMFKKIENG